MSTLVTLYRIAGSRVPHGDTEPGFTKSDPYCSFTMATAAHAPDGPCTTSRLSNTDSPEWPDTVEMVLPINFDAFEASQLRATVWDSDATDGDEDDVLGEGLLLISKSADATPKVIKIKGAEQKKRAGYTFPDFTLTLSYTVGPAPETKSPLALAFSRCTSCLTALLEAKAARDAQDAAALQIQKTAQGFRQRKEEKAQSNAAAASIQARIKGNKSRKQLAVGSRLSPEGEQETPSKSRPPRPIRGGGLGGLARAMTQKLPGFHAGVHA